MMASQTIPGGQRRTLTAGPGSISGEDAITVVDLCSGTAWAQVARVAYDMIGIDFEPMTVEDWSLRESARPPVFAVVAAEATIGRPHHRLTWSGSAARLPLLAVGRGRLSDSAREGLRRQGASGYVDALGAEDDIRRVMGRMTSARHWMRNPIGRMPPADVLQTVAEHTPDCQVVVTCPHAGALTDHLFDDGADTCDGSVTCTGFTGRLVLQGGRLTYAETARYGGMEALARCMALTAGHTVVQEVFLSPTRPNLDGSLQHLLIQAAQLTDEQRRDERTTNNFVAGSLPPRVVEPQVSTRSGPPPLPPEIAETVLDGDAEDSSESEDQMTSHLLGGRAGIRLAVRVAPDGHVIESSGNGDGESLGATAAMCGSAVSEAGETLGLGEIEGWVALTDGIAVYCSSGQDSLVTCLGASSRTAIGHLSGLIDRAKGGAA